MRPDLSAILFVVTLPHKIPSPAAFLSAFYLGCVPLGLSFFLWNRAMVGGNLVIIGFLSYLTPPLAVLFVAIMQKEAAFGQVLFGMCVILAASLAGRFFMKQKNR